MSPDPFWKKSGPYTQSQTRSRRQRSHFTGSYTEYTSDHTILSSLEGAARYPSAGFLPKAQWGPDLEISKIVDPEP